ncbi:hypothetical protein RISK_001282 [Rhodopirellula islandica]|uniref:Uncharacterized protein n=1 Tax=Rhodopirellula islandica TaxID=595434 RepID=A0A0J1BJX8_RHOIS|nr:hypothetical protein [Rhodopirellula islandica]KLU06718.1 hypothetical protein RISK_001282 [Rhodopirellula islandica]
MVDVFAKTPRYVLKDGANPTGPPVISAAADPHSVVIHGFSDKPDYDVFVSASSLELTPYPLVKGFLKNQCELDTDVLRLIVLDPVSPTQACLDATTLQAVLEALRIGSKSVPVSHRLRRDPSSSGYRIEPIACSSPASPLS